MEYVYIVQDVGTRLCYIGATRNLRSSMHHRFRKRDYKILYLKICPESGPDCAERYERDLRESFLEQRLDEVQGPRGGVWFVYSAQLRRFIETNPIDPKFIREVLGSRTKALPRPRVMPPREKLDGNFPRRIA